MGDSIGAYAALKRALAVEPGSLFLIEDLAKSHSFFGDLNGARLVLAAPTPGVDPDALIAYTATTGDYYWLLDDAQRQRLFTIPASTFLAAVGGNPRDRGLALAHTAWLGGDRSKARTYADSALPFALATARDNPTNADAHALLGDVEVYLGQRPAALRDAHEGVRIADLQSTAFNRGYDRLQLARVFTVLGESDSAVTPLEPVPSLMPNFLSRAEFGVDSVWAPLRANPRFQHFLAPHDSAAQAIAR